MVKDFKDGDIIEINVCDNKRIIEIWLTNKENIEECWKKSLQSLLENYKQKKYKIAIFKSGEKKLTDCTAGLLLHNRIF